MKVDQTEVQYNITLAPAETIEIKINDNTVFNKTVGTDFIAKITFMYHTINQT